MNYRLCATTAFALAVLASSEGLEIDESPLFQSFRDMSFGWVNYSTSAEPTIIKRNDTSLSQKRARNLQGLPTPPPEGAFPTHRAIRIHVDSTLAEKSLENDIFQRNYLLEDLLPATINKVRDFLSVIPVQGSLKLARKCLVHASLGEEVVCVRLARKPVGCGDLQIPRAHLESLKVCDPLSGRCEVLVGGKGASNTDFILYVTYDGEKCQGNTVGFGGSCVRDQFDRPIAGYINICPKRLKGYLPQAQFRWREENGFLVHEIFHALGFSGTDIAFFRDHYGNPRSSRRKDGRPYSNLLIRNLIFTANATSLKATLLNSATKTYSLRMVTPRVQQAAREHFGCPSLEGPLLENEGTPGTIYQHWDRRIAAFELMSPVTTEFPVLTTLTAAYFEDSGWYRADFSQTGEMMWGKGGLSGNGCDFVDMPCVHLGNAQSLRTYNSTSPMCLQLKGSICTNSHLSRGYCSLEKISPSTSTDPSMPWKQYFVGNDLKGSLSFMDNCPVRAAYKDGHCMDDSTSVPDRARAAKGTEHSDDSRCLHSSLLMKGWSTPGYSANEIEGLCYHTTCVKTGEKRNGDAEYGAIDITFKVDNHVTLRCLQEDLGIFKSVSSFQGYIQCPDVRIICWGAPCKNGGYWKYQRCVCAAGYTGSRCESTAVKRNRDHQFDYFYYPDKQMTLLLGKQYNILPEISSGSSASTNQFQGLRDFPKGLSIQGNTGAIYGVALGVTNGCEAFTVSVGGSNSALQQARTVVWINVVASNSELPTNAFEPCAAIISGNKPEFPLSTTSYAYEPPIYEPPNTGLPFNTYTPFPTALVAEKVPLSLITQNWSEISTDSTGNLPDTAIGTHRLSVVIFLLSLSVVVEQARLSC